MVYMGLHDLEQPNSWDVERGKPTHWLLDLEHWHGCLKDAGQAARAPMPGGDHLRRFRDHRHGEEVQAAASFQGAAMERMGDKDMEKSPTPNDEGAGIYLDFSGRVDVIKVGEIFHWTSDRRVLYIMIEGAVWTDGVLWRTLEI